MRDRAIACMNACAGMADPAKEIAAMREVIRQAQVALQDVSRRGRDFEDGHCPHALASYLQTMAERSLATLQPFLKP